MRDLNSLIASSNVPFDHVTTAYDINDAGQIAAEVVMADSPHHIALLTPIRPADVNCDGATDFFDIDPFLLALFDPVGYEAAYFRCDILLADLSGDGLVNFFDIDPFVACLTGGVCP